MNGHAPATLLFRHEKSALKEFRLRRSDCDIVKTQPVYAAKGRFGSPLKRYGRMFCAGPQGQPKRGTQMPEDIPFFPRRAAG